MISTDYLIVGSGLTGAVLARLLADSGRDVVVLDRRNHIGGNVHDELDLSGIRRQVYGPHAFRTNSTGIWNFVQQFAEFYPFALEVLTHVDGELEAWPVTESYLHQTVGEDWKPEFEGKPSNFEEASLSMMPRLVYEKFVQSYTQKQWGVHPKDLDANLARRFDVRKDNERKLSRHKFQGLPHGGFETFMKKLLDGIEIHTNVDYLIDKNNFEYRKKLIFTGPIDEFFDYKLGKLTYRGQLRNSEYRPEQQFAQCNSVVNYPNPADAPYVRRIEWKYFMEPELRDTFPGTLLTTETPYTPDHPDGYEYPFPDNTNAKLYKKYRTLADQLDNVLICGRLGEYRYFDMDQAIGRAFMLANRELGLNVQFLDEESISTLPE